MYIFPITPSPHHQVKPFPLFTYGFVKKRVSGSSKELQQNTAIPNTVTTRTGAVKDTEGNRFFDRHFA